jgi:hypothetical protein
MQNSTHECKFFCPVLRCPFCPLKSRATSRYSGLPFYSDHSVVLFYLHIFSLKFFLLYNCVEVRTCPFPQCSPSPPSFSRAILHISHVAAILKLSSKRKPRNDHNDMTCLFVFPVFLLTSAFTTAHHPPPPHTHNFVLYSQVAPFSILTLISALPRRHKGY